MLKSLTASARSDAWRTVAVQALDAYEATPTPVSSQAFTFSQALLATARLYGWDDPRVPALISEIMALRNPDGGWGVNTAWDAFQDGSTNPSTTTYTVTLAGHVGPALLAAYQHGMLPDGNNPEPLQKITALLMGTAQYSSSIGRCVSYSRAAADSATNNSSRCVHNVNAGVADYLTQANAAGFGATGLQKLVVDIVRFEIATYNPAWSGWSYMYGQTTKQDADHGSYTAASLYFAAYPVGREAAYQLLAAPATDDAGRRAHLRLVSLPGGPGSQALDGSGATLWAEMGDQWLDEASDYVTSSAGDASRLAQAAAAAAANSAAS